MSLINQVLQDLDRRHAMAGALPAGSRHAMAATRPPGPVPWRTLAGASAATLALAVAGVVALGSRGPGFAMPQLWESAAPSPRQPMSVTPPYAVPLKAMETTSDTSWPESDSGASPAALENSAAPTPDGLEAAAGTAGEAQASSALDLSALQLPPTNDATWASAPADGAMAPAGLSATSLGAADVVALSRLTGLVPREAVMPLAFAPALPAAASAQAKAEPTTLAKPQPVGDAPVAATSERIEAQVEKRLQPSSPYERADAQYQRGLALHQQGRLAEAEEAFASALREDPSHAPALEARAVALLEHGRIEDAQSMLAAGLGRNPRQTRLAATLARIQVQRHDLSGAMATLEAAFEGSDATASGTDRAEARALLATLQQGVGRHADAVGNFASALRSHPERGAWWIAMGISLSEDGRPERAREAFGRARSTDGLSPELRRYVDQRLGTAAAEGESAR